MAQLLSASADTGCEIFSLNPDQQAYSLDAIPPQPLRPHCVEKEVTAQPLLISVSGAEGEMWILVAGARSRVLVNGQPLVAGIHVLAHRDEIRIGDKESCWFSSERLAVVEPFRNSSSQRVFCPRCHLAIEPDTLSVKCPQCGLAHHEQGKLNCWTYHDKCASCAQGTAPDTGFAWSPADL